MGITELVDPPEGGVRAGIMYLDRQIKRMDPTIPFGQRVRFALAAYNVGYGHLVDARRLAAEIGLDPDRWFGNVENAIALLEDSPVSHEGALRLLPGHGAGPVRLSYPEHVRQLRQDRAVAHVGALSS